MRLSMVGPRLEKLAWAKPPHEVSIIAPTVITSAAAPGEATVQAPGPELPAATATTRPAATAALTASESASLPSEQPLLPSDRFSTRMP